MARPSHYTKEVRSSVQPGSLWHVLLPASVIEQDDFHALCTELQRAVPASALPEQLDITVIPERLRLGQLATLKSLAHYHTSIFIGPGCPAGTVKIPIVPDPAGAQKGLDFAADGVGQHSELISNSLHAHQEKARLLQNAGASWHSSRALVEAFIYIPPKHKDSASNSTSSSLAPRVEGPLLVFADNACGIQARDIHRSTVQFEPPPGHEMLDQASEYAFFRTNRFHYFGAGGFKALLNMARSYTCRARALSPDATQAPSVSDDLLSVRLDFDEMARSRQAGNVGWESEWTPANKAPLPNSDAAAELLLDFPEPVAQFIINWESTHATGTLFILQLRDSCARSWVGTEAAQYESTFREHMREVSLQFAFMTQQRWQSTAELVVPTITYTLQVGSGAPFTAVINNNRQGQPDGDVPSHSLTSVAANEHALAYALRCIDGATSSAEGEPFTVDMSELLGGALRGWYDTVGPVISYGVKAESSTKQQLHAQFMVANLPVINGVYTKEVLLKAFFPKKSSGVFLGLWGVTGVLTQHELTTANWPPFITDEFIRALGGPQEAAKRLLIFGFLHSPCLLEPTRERFRQDPNDIFSGSRKKAVKAGSSRNSQAEASWLLSAFPVDQSTMKPLVNQELPINFDGHVESVLSTWAGELRKCDTCFTVSGRLKAATSATGRAAFRSINLKKGTKAVTLKAGDVVRLPLSGGRNNLRVVNSPGAEFISGCAGYGSGRGKQKPDDTHLSRTFYGEVVHIEAPAVTDGAAADSSIDVAHAWLVLQRYPSGLFPASGKFVVPISGSSITKMGASECSNHMKELEQLLPELMVLVEAGDGTAVAARGGQQLRLMAGSSVKVIVPFIAAAAAAAGNDGRLGAVRKFSSATARDMMAMSDVYIRVTLCPNRQQVPDNIADSRKEELQVDEQGMAVFNFKLPTTAGSYDLLVDAFIKPELQSFERLARVSSEDSSGSTAYSVKPLKLSLDNCVHVLPGQLQLVDPAWTAMRRGSTATGPAAVLRMGTTEEGDEGLYHLPVALYDNGSAKSANRCTAETVLPMSVQLQCIVPACDGQDCGVAVKVVGSRYRTAADEPGLPGQLGDLLLSFYLKPTSRAGRLPFQDMGLLAELKVVVQRSGDASASSMESQPWAVQVKPGWPSLLGLALGDGELMVPGGDSSATPLAVLENGQPMDTVRVQLLDAYGYATDVDPGKANWLQCNLTLQRETEEAAAVRLHSLPPVIDVLTAPVTFAAGTGAAELRPALPWFSFASVRRGGNAKPLKLTATFTAEPAVHSTRTAAAAGTSSSRPRPRRHVTHILVEPCVGPVVLQLVRVDEEAAGATGTSAAGGTATEAVKAEVLASCKRSSTAELQLQLEAGSSTADCALRARNDCGELLCIKDMHLVVKGSATSRDMTLEPPPPGGACLQRLLNITAPKQVSNRSVDFKADVLPDGSINMFSVKVAVSVIPSSSTSSSTASLELATAGRAVGAGDLPDPLQSGVCPESLLVLRFCDKYGNLQDKKTQKQAFSSSRFPKITAAAVEQAGGMGFLLQNHNATAAAAELPREAFAWTDGGGATQPGYLLRGAALVGTLKPEQHHEGMPFVISVGSKPSLSGWLLPGPLRQFELVSPGIVPGGPATQLLRIPKQRVLLQDACGYNILQPAGLLGSITFKHSIADSNGKLVWQEDHKMVEKDLDEELSAAWLPPYNVKLPRIGAFTLKLQLLKDGGCVHELTQQLDVSLESPEVSRTNIVCEPGAGLSGPLTAGCTLPVGALRLKMVLNNGQDAPAGLYNSVTAVLVNSSTSADPAISLRVQPDANGAVLTLQSPDERLTRAGDYYVKGTYSEQRYEVAPFQPKPVLWKSNSVLHVIANVGESPQLRLSSGASSFIADNKDGCKVLAQGRAPSVQLVDGFGNLLEHLSRTGRPVTVTASIRLADAQLQLPDGCQLPQLVADGSVVQLDDTGAAAFGSLQLQAGSGCMQLPGQQQQQLALLLCFEASGLPATSVCCGFDFIDLHNLSREEAAVNRQISELQQELDSSTQRKAQAASQQTHKQQQAVGAREMLGTTTGSIMGSLHLFAQPATDVTPGAGGVFSLQALEGMKAAAERHMMSRAQPTYANSCTNQPEADRLQQQQGSKVMGQLSQLLYVGANITDAPAVAHMLSAFYKGDMTTMAVADQAAADACVAAAPAITKRWNVSMLQHSSYANRPGPSRLPHEADTTSGQPPAGNPRRAADLVSVRSDLLPPVLRGVEPMLLREVFGRLLLLDSRAAAQAYEQRYGAACPPMLTLDGFYFRGAGRDASCDQRPGPCSMGVLPAEEAQAALERVKEYEQLMVAFDRAMSSTQKLQQLEPELISLQASLDAAATEKQQLESQLDIKRAQLLQLQQDKQQQQARAASTASPGTSRKRSASARGADSRDAVAAAFTPSGPETRQKQARKQQEPQRFTRAAQQGRPQSPTRSRAAAAAAATPAAASRRKAPNQPPATPRKKPKDF